MPLPLRSTLAAAALLAATAACAQVTVYSDANFSGRSITLNNTTSTLAPQGFNDVASSVVVHRGEWEVCRDADFGGGCVVLRPGSYRNLDEFGLNDRLSSIRLVSGVTPGQGAWRPDRRPNHRIVLYEHDRFQGSALTIGGDAADLAQAGFNDRASSVIVEGGRWSLCRDANFGGSCVELRPGRYENLAAMGINDAVSSVRDDAGARRGRPERGRQVPIHGSPPWEREQ